MAKELQNAMSMTTSFNYKSFYEPEIHHLVLQDQADAIF